MTFPKIKYFHSLSIFHLVSGLGIVFHILIQILALFNVGVANVNVKIVYYTIATDRRNEVYVSRAN